MSHELNYTTLRMDTVVGVFSLGMHYETAYEYHITIKRPWSNIIAGKKRKSLGNYFIIMF